MCVCFKGIQRLLCRYNDFLLNSIVLEDMSLMFGQSNICNIPNIDFLVDISGHLMIKCLFSYKHNYDGVVK